MVYVTAYGVSRAAGGPKGTVKVRKIKVCEYSPGSFDLGVHYGGQEKWVTVARGTSSPNLKFTLGKDRMPISTTQAIDTLIEEGYMR